MRIHDCIVVGAGPAGSTALRELARLGLSALALDRAVFPRYKTCGGAISGITARELDFPWQTVAERQLSRVEVSFRLSRPLSLQSEDPYAWFVMRDRFDQTLVEEAMRAGGEFVDGCRVDDVVIEDERVVVLTEKGRFAARTIIAADGATGVVAKRLGFQGRRSGAALEAEVQVDGDELARYGQTALVSYGDPPWGYGWVFPKGEHLSVGVGTLAAPQPRLRQSLQAFLSVLGLAGAEMSVTGHPIPAIGDRRPLSLRRVLVAGDAAGLADPLSGEGIAHAVKSGKLAARAVAAAVESGDFSFVGYEAEIDRAIRAELTRAGSIARKLYRFPRLFFWLFQQNRSILEYYFQIVRGTGTYLELEELLRREFRRFGLFGRERPEPA